MKIWTYLFVKREMAPKRKVLLLTIIRRLESDQEMNLKGKPEGSLLINLGIYRESIAEMII
jgi:hypothetical protein